MTKKNKVWAIIPAGGVGNRMGADQPKQYLPLNGKPILHHTLWRICSNSCVEGAVVGVQESDTYWRDGKFTHEKLLGHYPAGVERADTVLNGLGFLLEYQGVSEEDWALVHDAVRPCIIQQDISNLIDEANRNQSGAILGELFSDTIKISDDKNKVVDTVDRNRFWRAFTPQVFRIKDLIDGLVSAISTGLLVTDESMAMEAIGIQSTLVSGHPSNIKVTLERDLELAEMYLQAFK